MNTVELVLSLSIPAATVGMVAFGVYELRRRKNRGGDGAPVTATYVNEFTAIFYGTKRMELDHRDSMSMMREEDAQGDRPWDLSGGITLDRGALGRERRPPPQP
ncbi:hypothetical protein JOD54_005780 [Actinokineospora baliensis]|uniref:DUF6191 domain-containing protein n=1 Tax=Actinokineospora baliensis TaxID=547056 RepID=UPI0027DC0274|nr:DUF6191 domain-containing protein [Actinokineospora baliensis]MBM7775576.1 hypothetical protein [Actinokineospora baliensis]